MKYFEIAFTLTPYSSDACDVLAALAGEVGFETFVETETGLTGYVQQSLFDEQALKEALEDFPFEGVSIGYDVQEAEDKDWNEQWEQEGFEPIVVECGVRSEECGVRNVKTLIIHDGRHLPADVSSLHTPHSSLLEIEIDAKLAFGTGTHETTRMICATLLDLFGNLSPLKALDCGTGTGILAICALKLGAKEAIGYDIDEWSVDNARHNAVINQVDDRFTSLLGDVTILKEVEGTFDLVMANINRNILLADMPMMHEKMAPGARLILSGFYTADIPMLTEKAQSLGMTLMAQKEDNDWACLVFQN
jgi:ribosomal protein L11 methyltransferase